MFLSAFADGGGNTAVGAATACIVHLSPCSPATSARTMAITCTSLTGPAAAMPSPRSSSRLSWRELAREAVTAGYVALGVKGKLGLFCGVGCEGLGCFVLAGCDGVTAGLVLISAVRCSALAASAQCEQRQESEQSQCAV